MVPCVKCGGEASTLFAINYIRSETEVTHALCEVCSGRIVDVIEETIRIHPNALIDSGQPYTAKVSGKSTGRGDAKI